MFSIATQQVGEKKKAILGEIAARSLTSLLLLLNYWGTTSAAPDVTSESAYHAGGRNGEDRFSKLSDFAQKVQMSLSLMLGCQDQFLLSHSSSLTRG
jgi:hypothetical protein